MTTTEQSPTAGRPNPGNASPSRRTRAPSSETAKAASAAKAKANSAAKAEQSPGVPEANKHAKAKSRSPKSHRHPNSRN